MTFEPKLKERTVNTMNIHIESLSNHNKYSMLLFGDSILERLLNYQRYKEQSSKIFNAGIGGDGIEHMLFRLKAGFLSHLPHIETIIILAGTNNIERYSSSKVYSGFLQLLEIIEATYPLAKIIILGLPPRYSSNKKKLSDAKILERIKEYNSSLSSLENSTKNIMFHDLSEMDFNDLCDHVHFSDAGYNKFIDLIFNKILI